MPGTPSRTPSQALHPAPAGNPSSAGCAGLVARLGTTVRFAEVRVLPPPAADPPLLINEIDYDQPGQDLAEFVELYNPTAALQPVAGLALVFVNGDDDGDPYLTIPLAHAIRIRQLEALGP